MSLLAPPFERGLIAYSGVSGIPRAQRIRTRFFDCDEGGKSLARKLGLLETVEDLRERGWLEWIQVSVKEIVIFLLISFEWRLREKNMISIYLFRRSDFILGILWKLSYSMVGIGYKFFKDIDFYYVLGILRVSSIFFVT